MEQRLAVLEKANPLWPHAAGLLVCVLLVILTGTAKLPDKAPKLDLIDLLTAGPDLNKWPDANGPHFATPTGPEIVRFKLKNKNRLCQT